MFLSLYVCPMNPVQSRPDCLMNRPRKSLCVNFFNQNFIQILRPILCSSGTKISLIISIHRVLSFWWINTTHSIYFVIFKYTLYYKLMISVKCLIFPMSHMFHSIASPISYTSGWFSQCLAQNHEQRTYAVSWTRSMLYLWYAIGYKDLAVTCYFPQKN